MPGRGKGRKGNGRPGQGKPGAKGGRFRINNSKKRKSKGSSNTHKRPTDAPELMDLSQGTYIPEYGFEVPLNSMRNLGRRPGKMMSEALYTGSHVDQTMKLPMRKRPVEFVKAKDAFDPNKELKKFEEVSLEDEAVEFKEAEIEVDDVAEANEERASPVILERDDQIEVQDALEKDEVERDEAEGKEVEKDKSGEVNDIQEVEFVIDEDADPTVDVSGIPPVIVKSKVDAPPLDSDNVLTIGKVSLNTRVNDQGEVEVDLPSIAHLNNVARPGFVDEHNFEEFEDFDEQNEDVYDDYKENMSDNDDELEQERRIMEQTYQSDTDEYESETNFDIMAESSDEERADESETTPGDPGTEEDNVDEDPEYGFLEEDYDFDVSKISVSNVRLGLQNQYYTSCYEYFGHSEPTWLDESDIKEYVLENGVKEHRLESFIKFLTKDLITDVTADQPNYSDVYVSSDEEELESEDEYKVDSDDDNLDDLIAFTKTKPRAPDELDLEPTRSIRLKGKGKKKQIDIDHDFDMDTELRQSLQEQYLTQRDAKRMRKKAKEDKLVDEGFANNDLFVKYPYTLHIRDIKDELEEFLHDSTRTRLKFPPLDPHGNKTVSKMAECFNFKSKRAGGNGLHLFMEVTKNKRTFLYIPNYNRVAAFMRQRPIFNRIDQKRPKDEITQRDGNKDKDRRRGRDKGSNANVREGDIVGEKAPEIDPNNIGRKLLEKMGWAKGEGLGAIGNQGINEPVIAKVKMTKLGLK